MFNLKYSLAAKRAMLLSSLVAMAILFFLVSKGNSNIPQKIITIELSVKNKVNICTPEDEKIFEKSFFNF